MKRTYFSGFMLIIMASILLLAACSGETDTPVEGVEKTIYIGPQMVDCIGVSPQKCLQLKEDPADPYTLLYDPIEGLEYEEGFEYELLILEEEIENPPADGSAFKWSLIEVTNKTQVNDPYPAPEEITESDAIVTGEVMTIFIGPEMIDCEGTAPQKCLLVTSDPASGYTIMYDPIAGFEYEPGFEYELQVLAEPVENPPADGSSMRYTLLEVVNKNSIAIDENLLENKVWLLKSYSDNNGSIVNVLPESRITAVFQEGKLIGTSGCNNYFGDYQLAGGSIAIEILSSPQLFCEPVTLMNQEAGYIEALSQATGMELTEETLHFNNNQGQTNLFFTVEQPTPLIGTTWDLQFFNDGQSGLLSTIDNSQVTATFNDNGILEGFTGCNEYNASYLVDGDAIALGPVAATATFCNEPAGIMEQETLFLGSLEQVVKYRQSGATLVLFDAASHRMAAFTAVDQNGTILDQPAKGDEIIGVVWTWGSTTTPSEQLDILEPGNYTLELNQDGSAVIQADCNSGIGDYSVDNGQMAINIFSTTLNACPPDSHSDLFIRSIQSTGSYNMENGTLLLELLDGGGSMRFMPQE